MGPDFVTGQNDTGVTFTDSLMDPNGNTVNLTGCTVKFVAGLAPPNAPAINGAATVVNAALGSVSYQPSVADTATAAYYQCWWRVTVTAGGAVTDYPIGGFRTMLVAANDF